MNEIYYGNPWLDETFEKKLKRVNEGIAFKITVEGLHSIAQILSHVKEWKKEILLRFTSGKKQLNMHDPKDWISNNDLINQGWNSIKNELFETHDEFLNFLKKQDDNFLQERYSAKAQIFNRQLIEGCLHHDIYHLGQIGLLIRLIQLYA